MGVNIEQTVDCETACFDGNVRLLRLQFREAFQTKKRGKLWTSGVGIFVELGTLIMISPKVLIC